MRQFFIIGLLSLFWSAAIAQATTQSAFVGTCQFTGFTASGPNVVGTIDNFLDQTNLYFASNIQPGDVAWDNLGTRWEIVSVTSSNLVQAVVEMRNINGTGGLPFGVGFVSRETPNIGLSMLPPDNSVGISPQLKSRVEGHNALVLDNFIADSIPGDGNGIYGGSDTIPGNVTVSMGPEGTSSLLFNSPTPSTTQVFLEARKKLPGNSSKWYSISQYWETRSTIGLNGHPTWCELLQWNGGSGFEWTSLKSLDTTNNIIYYGYGGRFSPSFINFYAERPTGAGLAESAVPFNFGLIPGNGTANSDVFKINVSGTGDLIDMNQDGKTALLNIFSYVTDLSANYTSRTLVDKGYSDTRLGGRNLLNTTAPAAGQTYLWDDVDNRYEIGTPGDGNGIYSGPGSVPNGTAATLLGTLSFNTPGGAGLHLNQAGNTHFIGQSAGTRVQVNPTSNGISMYGNGTDPANVSFQDADGSAQVILAADDVVNGGGYKITLPADQPQDGEQLVYNGSGVYDWSTKSKMIRYFTSGGVADVHTVSFPSCATLGQFNNTRNTAEFVVASAIDFFYSSANTGPKTYVLNFTASGDTPSGVPVEFSYEINSLGKVVIATELGSTFSVAGQSFVTLAPGQILRFYVRPTSGALTVNLQNYSASLQEF